MSTSLCLDSLTNRRERFPKRDHGAAHTALIVSAPQKGYPICSGDIVQPVSLGERLGSGRVTRQPEVGLPCAKLTETRYARMWLTVFGCIVPHRDSYTEYGIAAIRAPERK